MNNLKLVKHGTSIWYYNEPVLISDYSQHGLGKFYAESIQHLAAKDDRAHDGRGFYIYDHTGDTVGVFKTLGEAKAMVQEWNNVCTQYKIKPGTVGESCPELVELINR